MQRWMRFVLPALLAATITACGPASEVTGPGADPTPHEVTAEYTPGQVSQSPTIEPARPNVTGGTLAGSGGSGSVDGSGPNASFDAPEGLAVTSDGTVYVAEPYGYRIRRITSDGTVTTLAGGGTEPGRQDGQGSEARFMGPKDVAIAPQGDLYVVDFDAVRRITPAGTVTTLSLHNTDGSPYHPIELFGIAIDTGGNLYLSSTNWIDRVGSDGTVTRYAGNEDRGFADGPAGRNYFNLPHKLAFDKAGNLYVADYGNLRIRRIAPDRSVTTVAGNGILGYTDGPAVSSRLNFPSGVAVDGAGNVLVADTYNHAVRQITPDGMVSTIAGNNTPGYTDGSGTIEFQRPTDVAVQPDGAILVADSDNARVRILR
ncbi:MAG TPA: hypothetical protein V6D05_15360 [Stenomitos sp.]